MTGAAPSDLSVTDGRSSGFATQVDPSRYDGCVLDEFESHGMALAVIERRSKVLDVGCGSGAFAWEVANRKHCKVVGVEPNPERAAAAEARGLMVHRGYLTRNGVDAVGPQDYVLLMDVLEHCDDPVSVLGLAREALTGSGKVIISVPNVAHWTVRLRLLLGRFDYTPTGIMDATHLRWFTRRTLLSVVNEAGLRPMRVDVSRGLWLGEYQRRPLGWMRGRARRLIVNWACRGFPQLFGAQHFVVCERAY